MRCISFNGLSFVSVFYFEKKWFFLLFFFAKLPVWKLWSLPTTMNTKNINRRNENDERKKKFFFKWQIERIKRPRNYYDKKKCTYVFVLSRICFCFYFQLFLCVLFYLHWWQWHKWSMLCLMRKKDMKRKKVETRWWYKTTNYELFKNVENDENIKMAFLIFVLMLRYLFALFLLFVKNI